MKSWLSVLLAGLVGFAPLVTEAQQYKVDKYLHEDVEANAEGESIDVSGFNSVTVTIKGTSVDAEFSFQGRGEASGSDWSSLTCFKTSDTTRTAITSTTEVGIYQCNVAGLDQVKVPVSEYVTGTITVFARATHAVFASGAGGGGGGGGAGTLDQAFDGGKVIDGANSLANAFRVGDGTTPMCQYTDATLGPVIRPCTDANTRTYIWSGFNWSLYTVGGSSPMLTVDPALTDNEKYAWASGYRPIKTISLPADALYPRGASALVTSTALISGGLISPYITITDSDSDGFYRYLVMPANWDGGTVTVTVTVVNVNATPANAFEVDVSGACYPAGTAIPTTISTTGEQAATISFGASGSCGGSACNQNDPASATTAAITINGTPAGGNFCGFQAQVDATATTETAAGIKIVNMDINFKNGKGF